MSTEPGEGQSVFIGLALASSLVVLTGASQRQPVVANGIPPSAHVVGHIPAEWWTHVSLVSDGFNNPILTYTVPLERYLVVTQVRANAYVSAPPLDLVNQMLGLYTGSWPYLNLANGTRVVVPPGATLTTSYPGTGGIRTAELWGYLEPVR